MADSEQYPLIDWRQGDIVLAPLNLPIVVDRDGAKAQVQFLVAEHGIAVISQSCDVVRSTENCPYVQVAPLVRVEEDEVEQILRRKRPRLVIVPGLIERGLAIDLDACATISKGALASDDRIVGCPSDIDQLAFSRALSRHRGRFAYPDNFNREIAGPVAKWISEKYKKQGHHGDLVRSIVEVRVRADNWINPSEITFYLYREEPLPTAWPKDWHEALKTLEQRASKSKNYPNPDFVLTTFQDESAADYRDTIELDWDGLSPID